ncbi:MAG: alpha/beta fold hydrolase [Solirubrobacterales bacterium]
MGDYRLLSRTRDLAERHHIAVSGEGTTTVVLGNGYGTDLNFWSGILPWLERRYRVVRFDWATDPTHFEASRYADIDAYAEDLLAVLCATNAPPCVFIGHSMSGMVGMAAAEMEPTFFRQMVMLAPAPRYVSDEGYVAGFDNDAIDALLGRMGENYMAWIEEFAPRAVGNDGGASAIDEFARSLEAMRPDIAYAMALTVFHLDVRDRLDAFTTPTTIIQPTDDPAVPVAVGEYLAGRWPHARLEIIEASGHFPHLTAPGQVIAVLGKVLPGA